MRYHDGEWSEAKFRSHIISVLRKATMYWKPKNRALALASVGRRLNPETGRMCEFFKCAGCGLESPRKNNVADHIVPIVGENGFEGFDRWVEKAFVNTTEYQILCKHCHTSKSNSENEVRRNGK